MARKKREVLYYKPLPGSKELVTAPAGGTPQLKKLENAWPGETVKVEYNGETLHSGLSWSEFPTGLFDDVMPALDAVQQAVLGHLHRLSAGNGADWVRVGKKELMGRTGLSARRLLKALSGLAEKTLIRPLHRDINGTLYKMYTVEKTPHAQGVKQATKKTEKHTPQKKQVAKPREKPLESPINEEAFPGTEKIITIREIATQFFSRAAKKPNDADIDSALAQITYLLEDGFTRDEVLRAAMFLAETFGKKADISKLPYYIHQAINEKT